MSAPSISSYWNEEGQEKESLLHSVMEFLLPRKYLIAMDQGWSDWDLEICQGPWAKAQIKTATENHGGSKRVLRVRCALRMSQNLDRVSLHLSSRSGYRGVSGNAEDRRRGRFYRLGSRQRHHLSEVPPRTHRSIMFSNPWRTSCDFVPVQKSPEEAS